MVGSGLVLGGLLATGLLVLMGVRPRSFGSEVARAAEAAWQGALGPSAGHDDYDPFPIQLQLPVELPTPSAVPETVPVAFPGYLLPGDEPEETPHAGS
jgi:hypothetical protein